MTSYYNQVPTLAMRARAAQLVVVGRVGRVLEVESERHDGVAYVRTTYEVDVDDVLKGEAGAKRIAVQVLGGVTGQDSTPTSLPVREGAPLVLMLSDAGKPGVFVPYLGSAFMVTPDGRVTLGDRAAEKLGVLGAAHAAESGITLEGLKKLVAEVTHDEASTRADDEAAAKPPPVTEMPTGVEGGGRSAAPEVRGPDEAAAPAER